ncbi:MAG: HK97 gp10 family phage protein [Eubacteriales bacterium]
MATSIDDLSVEIMKGLTEYADLVAEDMKSAVKKASTTVKNEIKANAPKDSGTYASSFAAKTTSESATSLTMTVYSKTRYSLAHLLEFGHAKRGGGRTAAQPHIAPAEEVASKQLEEEMERSIRNG